MKQLRITVNGVAYDVTVEEISASAESSPAAPAAPAKAAANAPAASPAQTAGVPVKAPMSGNIINVCVTVGQQVKKGDTVVVLEAMKMENDIPAPQDGVVESVLVAKGDSVNSDAVVATIK